MITTLIACLLYIITTVNGICPDENVFTFYTDPSVNAPTGCPVAKDCKAWLEAGLNISGIYPVNPDGKEPFQVYCDMETDGGGWTVFQRRQDGFVNFIQTTAAYQSGFGDLNTEFWLGLNKVHRLTPVGDNDLRIELGDFDGNKAYAEYHSFEILDTYTQNTLYVYNYTGNAGDSLGPLNVQRFIVQNRDQGNYCYRNSGGWWFRSGGYCYTSHLNGAYVFQGPTAYYKGLIWNTWKGHYYSLKSTEMKIRRHN